MEVEIESSPEISKSNDIETINKRTSLLLSGLFVIQAAFLVELSFLNPSTLIYSIVGSFCKCFACLVFITGYISLTNRNGYTQTTSDGWLIPLQSFLLGAGSFLMIYFLLKNTMPAAALASSSAFLIPFILCQVYDSYGHLLDRRSTSGMTVTREATGEVYLKDNRAASKSSKNKFQEDDHEERLRNQKEVFESDLRHEYEMIKQKQKEIYEKELLMLQEEMKQKQQATYDAQLKQMQEELLERQKLIYLNDLKHEEEQIKKKQKEEFENEVHLMHEELKTQQKEAYQNQLILEEEEMRLKRKQAYDLEMKAIEAEMNRRKNIYEEELKLVETEMLSKKEAFRATLIAEQDEMKKKQKETFENELIKQNELAAKLKLELDEQINSRKEEIRLAQLEAAEIKIERQKEQLRRDKELFEQHIQNQNESSINEVKVANGYTENDASTDKIESITLKEASPILVQMNTKTVCESEGNEASLQNNVRDPKNDNSHSNETRVVFLNGVNISLRLTTNSNGRPIREDLKTKASLKMPLAEFFDHALHLNKGHIDRVFLSESNALNKWTFYSTGLIPFRKKKLNPELSLRENNITQTSVIHAELNFA